MKNGKTMSKTGIKNEGTKLIITRRKEEIMQIQRMKI